MRLFSLMLVLLCVNSVSAQYGSSGSAVASYGSSGSAVASYGSSGSAVASYGSSGSAAVSYGSAGSAAVSYGSAGSAAATSVAKRPAFRPLQSLAANGFRPFARFRPFERVRNLVQVVRPSNLVQVLRPTNIVQAVRPANYVQLVSASCNCVDCNCVNCNCGGSNVIEQVDVVTPPLLEVVPDDTETLPSLAPPLEDSVDSKDLIHLALCSI